MESIIVVFPKAEDASRIRGLLIRGGCSVYAACCSGAAALQAADRLGEGTLVCAVRLPDMMYDRLFELLPGSFDMLVLASQRMIEEEMVETFVGGGTSRAVIRTLALPAPMERILSELEALEERRSLRRRAHISVRHRTDEDRQVLDLAKRALMERRGITEEEAHRYIQKASMDSGTNVVETAQMILRLLAL